MASIFQKQTISPNGFVFRPTRRDRSAKHRSFSSGSFFHTLRPLGSKRNPASGSLVSQNWVQSVKQTILAANRVRFFTNPRPGSKRNLAFLAISAHFEFVLETALALLSIRWVRSAIHASHRLPFASASQNNLQFDTLLVLPAANLTGHRPFRVTPDQVSFSSKLRSVASRARNPKSSFGSGLENDRSLVTLSHSQTTQPRPPLRSAQK